MSPSSSDAPPSMPIRPPAGSLLAAGFCIAMTRKPVRSWGRSLTVPRMVALRGMVIRMSASEWPLLADSPDRVAVGKSWWRARSENVPAATWASSNRPASSVTSTSLPRMAPQSSMPGKLKPAASALSSASMRVTRAPTTALPETSTTRPVRMTPTSSVSTPTSVSVFVGRATLRSINTWPRALTRSRTFLEVPVARTRKAPSASVRATTRSLALPAKRSIMPAESNGLTPLRSTSAKPSRASNPGEQTISTSGTPRPVGPTT